jgi:hypothetical protein
MYTYYQFVAKVVHMYCPFLLRLPDVRDYWRHFIPQLINKIADQGGSDVPLSPWVFVINWKQEVNDVQNQVRIDIGWRSG